MSNMYFSLDSLNNAHKQTDERIVDAIDRLQKRTYFHTLLYKLYYLVEHDKIKLVIENPATTPSYLIGTQNFIKPTIIDKNRMTRGDYFKKPTQFFFVNCRPTFNLEKESEWSEFQHKVVEQVHGFDRSRISPEFAKNFVELFLEE